MSQMSELDMTIREMRRMANSLNEIADTLCRMFSGSAETSDVLETTPDMAATAEVSGTTAAVESAAETEPQLTLAEVRSVLSEVSKAGYSAQIRALLGKYGAEKLSEVSPQDYQSLLNDVGGITNAT